jgi:hypothetical protein
LYGFLQHKYFLTSHLNEEFSSISQKNGVIYTGTNGGKIYKHSPNLDAKLFFDTKENNHILFLDFNSFPNWNFFTGNGFYAQDISKNKLYHNYTSVKNIVKINDTIVGIASTGYAGKIKSPSVLQNNLPSLVIPHKLLFAKAIFLAKTSCLRFSILNCYSETLKCFILKIHPEHSKI